MNKCIETEIQERLPDLLHGSLDEHARRQVETHLAGCESCREDLDIIRNVKAAAVFAPAIDVDRVVRQIPPYRMIVPGVERPVRARAVTWLVAAGLMLAIIGGGSLVVSNRINTSVPRVVTITHPQLPPNPTESTASTAPLPRAEAAAPAHPQALALSTDLDNLSDGNLVRLMN